MVTKSRDRVFLFLEENISQSHGVSHPLFTGGLALMLSSLLLPMGREDIV